MENQQPSLVNHAVKAGFILGVISIVLTALFYVVSFEWLVSFKMWFFSIAVAVGYVAYAGIQYRKESGGYMTFGKAYTYSIIAFALGALVLTIFNFILYNLVDTELPAKLTEVAVRNAEEMMAKFGMPQEQMEATIEQTRQETAKGFKVTGLLLGYVYSLIAYAVIALISALIIKKKEPEVV